MTASLITISQSRQIDAAAALLRVGDREKFIRDVAARLNRHPTDADVAEAINAVTGIMPTEGPTSEPTWATKQKESNNHGPTNK
jgi:hypothetical protein